MLRRTERLETIDEETETEPNIEKAMAEQLKHDMQMKDELTRLKN